MILRTYRVVIHPELREAFEPLFDTVARSSVVDAVGCMKVMMGYPSDKTPDEYAVISIWDSGESLRLFAGEDWSRPLIPARMEKFVHTCWVHHHRLNGRENL